MGSFTNPQTGGTPVVQLINAATGSVPAGTPVYMAAAGAFNAAQASSAPVALVIGLLTADCAAGAPGLVQTSDVVTLTTAQWDACTGGSGGLTFGTPYYLSAAAAGQFTATPLDPTNPANVGKFIVLLGVALSTTQLRLLIQPPIGL